MENLIVDEDELETEIAGVIEVLDKVTATRYKFRKRFPNAITVSSTNGSANGEEANDNESVAEVRSTEADELASVMSQLTADESPKIEAVGVNDGRRHTMVKLPKLEIQKFNGDACKWQSFWSQFNTAVHGNTSLTKTQKFVYLNSYLVDDALRAVTGLEITDGNYDAAISILKQRFGRRDVVVTGHMKKLLSLSPLRSSTDVKGLRKLFDTCEVEIRSLESMGISSSMFGCLLCPVLMNALPEDLAFDFQMRRTNDDDVNAAELLKFVRNVIEAKERALAMSSSRRERNVNESDRRHNDRLRDPRRMASAATLQVSSDSTECLFCGNSHSAFKCDKDAKLKFDKLRSDKRCFSCFGKGHSSTSCKRNESCAKCKRKHHISVCFARQEEAVNETQSKPSETIVSTANARSTVLLQTASAQLGLKGGPTVRILLDGGSETSFVLQTLSEKHKLPVVSENFVNVYTFGNEKPTLTTRKTVQLILRSFVNDQEITITAAESKVISSAIVMFPNENLVVEMKKRKLPLAEVNGKTNGDNVKISVLIGSDYYWKVATGKKNA